MEKRNFTVTQIDGDYAYLKDEENGEELFIAMALLPLGTDLGSSFIYENFAFILIE